MVINVVGNYGNGYVGEIGDLNHIAREMERLGHTVRCIPQDEWREFVIHGTSYPNIPTDLKADINIITKWHHFYDGSFIVKLRELSQAPVFYWLWDYMYDNGFPDWHVLMAKTADLYVTNEYGIKEIYKQFGVNKVYFFPFDVCDGDLPVYRGSEKKYDVVFLGSYLEQGHRIEWLDIINKKFPITFFSWNYREWKKRGMEAYPPVYGADFNKIVSESKIILGFSVNPNCWGYWSNRVGKVLRAGGCLLYEYAPGMELFLGDAADYFSSPQEAIEKITLYLSFEEIRKTMEHKALAIGSRFTSQERIKQLCILMKRFIVTGGKDWNH